MLQVLEFLLKVVLMIKESIGNNELMNLPKTAFLCSRQVPAGAVLKCYDWAIAQRYGGWCIISGFHSTIEKDVLHYLLKGKQPIIVALARGLKEKVEPALQKPLDQGRLLIVTPFNKEVKRVTRQTAHLRNQMMIELADEIVIGFVNKGGMLEGQINDGLTKRIVRLYTM